MIHLTLTDSEKTVVSVPVKSLSRWQKPTKHQISVIEVGKFAMTEVDVTPVAGSVVYFKDGTVLYVLETPPEIDARYAAASRGQPEPLRKSDDFDAGGGRTLTWTEIVDALRDAQVFSRGTGDSQYVDETSMRIALGFK